MSEAHLLNQPASFSAWYFLVTEDQVERPAIEVFASIILLQIIFIDEILQESQFPALVTGRTCREVWNVEVSDNHEIIIWVFLHSFFSIQNERFKVASVTLGHQINTADVNVVVSIGYRYPQILDLLGIPLPLQISPVTSHCNQNSPASPPPDDSLSRRIIL